MIAWPDASDLRLLAFGVLMAWPMQLHAKHVPPADPLAIPGFALLAYLAWPLVSVAAVWGIRRGPAVVWLAGMSVLTGWMSMSGAFGTWTRELLAVGLLAAGSAGGLALWSRPDVALGLGPGRWRSWGPLGLVGMGVAVLVVQIGAALSPELLAFYPVYAPARTSVSALIGWELAMGVYMGCWEAWFRGILLFATRKRLGDAGAVLLQAVPFFLLHAPKPELEMAMSMLGGILLGYFCLWARSCWPAALWHATQYAAMEVTAVLHGG